MFLRLYIMRNAGNYASPTLRLTYDRIINDLACGWHATLSPSRSSHLSCCISLYLFIEVIIFFNDDIFNRQINLLDQYPIVSMRRHWEEQKSRSSCTEQKVLRNSEWRLSRKWHEFVLRICLSLKFIMLRFIIGVRFERPLKIGRDQFVRYYIIGATKNSFFLLRSKLTPVTDSNLISRTWYVIN